MSSENRDRQWWAVTIGVLALVYLIGAGIIVLAAAALRGDGGSGGDEAGGDNKAAITLSEFKIEGDLSVPEGDVELDVTNAGSVEHNLVVTDLEKQTPNIAGGSSAKLALSGLKAGTYEVYCAIPGHKDAGMVANLVVGGSGEATDTAAASGSHSMTQEEGARYDKAMVANMTQFLQIAGLAEPKLAGTKGDPTIENGPVTGNQKLAPTEILADGTKVFDITARVGKWEVEPGKVVEAWMYNDQVPGPWIKVNLNDKVKVRFKNLTPAMSDIHWHGIHLPNSMDGVSPYTQDTVPSGTDFTYEFVADRLAVGMYHAHSHGEQAVPNGMFGMFTIGDMPLPKGRTIGGIEIPADVRPVLEMPMILNDAGNIGFSLNGKSFPATAQSAAAVVKLNDWFIVHYQSEGLQIHPMHMHGFPQLIYAKDGIPLDQPYWADTINIAPGERYTVLVKADTVGAWVWHCHILTHVEQKDRLFGMAGAVVVTP